MCPECGEVKESKFFPFPKRQECYLCYEKVTGTYQKAFRMKIGVDYSGGSARSIRYSQSKNKIYRCSSCRRESNQAFILCTNCGTYNSAETIVTGTIVKKKTTTSSGVKAVDPERLEAYLQSCDAYGKPIVIRYQSKRKNSANHWRTIYMDGYNDTYITVRNNDNIPIRYRRDRVVEIKY